MSNGPTKREQIQAKLNRVHAARMTAEKFIHAEGNMNSKEAVDIGVELVLATNELASEFGQGFPKDIT